MSASPWVIAQATDPLKPKCGNPGSPGNVAPVTSKSGQVTRHCQYTFGVSSARCESLQITAAPCAVRRPLTAHALEPGSISARKPRCRSMSPSASSSSPATGRVSLPSGGTATGDPGTGRDSSRSNAAAPGPGEQHRVHQLVLPLPHQHVPHQERRDGVPRPPGLDRVLPGQRQRPLRDGLVHAARVGLEGRPDRRRHHRQVELGRGGEAEPPGEHVTAQRGEARDLRPAPAGPPPVVVQLEQPVLGAGVAHARPRARGRLGPHVRHPVPVATDEEVHHSIIPEQGRRGQKTTTSAPTGR